MGFTRDPQRHLVAEDLGDRREVRIREWVGGRAGAVENAAAGLDLFVHLGEFPAHALELADRTAEGLALARIANSFLEGAFREPERDAGIEAALRIEGAEQAHEAVVAHHQIFERQLAILEANLMQVFATHGVERAAHRKTRSILLDQHAADAGAPGLLVDPGEDHEHAGFVGTAD